VKLSEAALSNAHLSQTVFARCLDLAHALGLDTLRYTNRSSIDLESLRAGLGDFPDDFLEGVGVALREVEALRGALAAG
jgi:hypothetical protein